MPIPPPLPPDVEDRLRCFTSLLGRWTARINLVSAADAGAIWQRHVLDSLRLVALIPQGTARGIDLGSGGGMPGLVLAIATGMPFDLVEADARKAAFLREAARECAAPATVHHVRIESCALPPAPLVTARALAPLPRLLGLVAPLLAQGGVALLPKGTRAESELVEAQSSWRFRLERFGPADGPVLRVSAIEALADA